MKLMGFKKIPITNNVSAMAMMEVTVTMDEVIDGRYVDVRSVMNSYRVQCGPLRYMEYIAPYKALSPLRFNTNNGQLLFTGFLYYRNESDLMDSILKQYVPGHHKGIDDIFNHSADDDTRRQKLADYLLSTSSRYRSSYGSHTFPVFPAVGIENNRFMGINEDDNGNHLFSTSNNRDFVLRIDREKEVKGKKILFWEFITIFPCRGAEYLAVYSDRAGKNTYFTLRSPYFRSLARWLGKDIVEDFEERGRSVEHHGKYDWFKEADKKTTVLIRVPSRDELSELTGSLKGEMNDKPLAFMDAPPALSRPLFIRDARTAGAPPENAQIIENGYDALYVLSRTVNSVYVPGDVSSNNVEELAEDNVYYLAGKELNI